MKNFRVYNDANGVPTDIMEASDSRHAIVLTAGIAKSIIVPGGATAVTFNATGPFWVQYGAAATLPVVDDISGDAPELAPAARWGNGGMMLGLVAPAACTVSISFYEVRA